LFINTNPEKVNDHFSMKRNIKQHYSYISSFDIPNSANKPLLCTNRVDKIDLEVDIASNVKAIQKYVVGKHNGKLNANNFNLISLVSCLLKQ